MGEVQPDVLLSVTATSVTDHGHFIMAHYPFDESQPLNVSYKFPRIMENLFQYLNVLTQQLLANQDLFELQAGDIKYIASPICLDSNKSCDHKSYLIFFLSTFSHVDSVTLHFYASLLRKLGVVILNDGERLSSVFREITHNIQLYQKEIDPTSFCLHKLSSYFSRISPTSLLARVCKQLFLQLRQRDGIHVELAGGSGVHVSLADHQLLSSPPSFEFILRNIRPYHSLVLRERNKVTKEFGNFVSLHSSRRSLSFTAGRMGVTWEEMRYVAAYLVYWGRAALVFPIDGTSMYKTTDNFGGVQGDLSNVEKRFNLRFPQHSLFWALNKIIPAVSLSQILELHSELCRDKISEVIEWLMKNDILEQLHHYFYHFPSPGESPLEISPYLRGHHHLEEITHLCNIRRTALLNALQGRDVVVDIRTDPVCQLLKFNYL